MNPNSTEFIDAINTVIDDQKKFGNSKLADKNPFLDDFVKDGTYSEVKENILYRQVCRGDVVQSLLEQSKLHCRYVSNSHFSKLARFKIEEFNLDPAIIIFYDILTDDDIEFLKQQSKTRAVRGEIIPDGSNVTITGDRVAQISWHDDDDHKIIRKLSRRLEARSG